MELSHEVINSELFPGDHGHDSWPFTGFDDQEDVAAMLALEDQISHELQAEALREAELQAEFLAME